MTTTILAVDLGKFNSVLCWYDPQTQSAAFRTARSSVATLRDELVRQPVERTRVSIPAATPPRRRPPSGIEPAL